MLSVGFAALGHVAGASKCCWGKSLWPISCPNWNDAQGAATPTTISTVHSSALALNFFLASRRAQRDGRLAEGRLIPGRLVDLASNLICRATFVDRETARPHGTNFGNKRMTLNRLYVVLGPREGLTRNADAAHQSKCFLMPNILGGLGGILVLV